MLRAAGRPTTRLGAALALAAALVVGVLLSGCNTNPESDLSVDEGQPVKLGDLLYNVEISRFLNPRDPEDRAYLAGQPPPPNDKLYLGVFMLIQNESDTAQEVPADFKVVDTEGTEFKPIPSNSLFALKLGGTGGRQRAAARTGVHRRQRAHPGVDGALPDRRGRNRGPAPDPPHPVKLRLDR